MSAPYRYELKFLLNPVQHAEFMGWLYAGTQLRTSYPARTVNSLYFDDAAFQGVRENLAGLPDRSKFRLRWYGDAVTGSAQDLKLEIKTRTGRLGAKQTLKLPALEDELFGLTAAALLPEIAALLQEAEGALPAHSLLPVLYLRYDRDYFEDGQGLRATIDTSVRYQPVQLASRVGDMVGAGNAGVVAELKFAPEEKDRVSFLMRRLHVVPQRHSKYLTGMAMAGVTSYL